MGSMNTFMIVIVLIGQGNSGWASQPEREVVAALPSSSRDVLEFARRPLPFKYRWVADPEPEPRPEPEKEQPTITPNATAAQDAKGFTFYSLIDARGFTHWSYDWPRLWNEVQAVNAGADADAATRAAQYATRVSVQPTYGQPATYGYGYSYGTGGSGGRPQPWVVRTGVYGRPLAALPLPALGGAGAGAVCST
jgi:hypothetical protein